MLFLLGLMCAPFLTTAEAADKLNRTDKTNIIVEVQQRFYEFQDATSALKQSGHNPDPTVFPAALNKFLSFIDPNYSLYEFITVGQIFPFPTLQDISDAYTYYATVLFNGWSQHFSTNCVVTPLGKCQANMTSGGGEWASLNNLNTTPPTPFEQTTISNWVINWVYLCNGPTGPDWYIHSYQEYGDRLFTFCPPCGPYSLEYARTFPGATPETGVPNCSNCLD